MTVVEKTASGREVRMDRIAVALTLFECSSIGMDIFWDFFGSFVHRI